MKLTSLAFRRLRTHVRRQFVGYLALFVALGGTAYAFSLPARSVGSKHLRAGAVSSSKVKDRSLLAKDFKPGELAAATSLTTITTGDSEFGTMLFDSNRQAIYIFERDPANETVCYGTCAELWPPVYAGSEVRAEGEVKADLLGTVRRKDGRLQVTYAGKPLYFYAHEGRGQVRCHNVNNEGGFWWVVGPDGAARP